MPETLSIVPNAKPKKVVRHRSPHGPGLFVTDLELIEKLGLPEKVGAAAIASLDSRNSGFPKKQAFWGDRRYWPACLAYFEFMYGFKVGSSVTPRERTHV